MQYNKDTFFPLLALPLSVSFSLCPCAFTFSFFLNAGYMKMIEKTRNLENEMNEMVHENDREKKKYC